MLLQTIDSRPPLSAVISMAKAERDPNLPKWRDDMTTMSAEIARKYFGTLTEEVVRDGVNACVNLLSLGLLRSTSGAVEPVAWLQSFRAAGVRGVSRLAVELIKTCDSLPNYALLTDSPTPAPSFLLPLLTYASQHGPTRAYSYLVREAADRAEFKRSIDLARWLSAHTPSGRVVQRSMADRFGWESPDADEVIHHILSLACGVTKVDPFAQSNFSEDEEPDLAPLELPVTALGPTLLSAARKRYEELVAKIPPPLRLALIYQDSTWFERFIVPATKKPKPPAPPTAKPAKNSAKKKASKTLGSEET